MKDPSDKLYDTLVRLGLAKRTLRGAIDDLLKALENSTYAQDMSSGTTMVGLLEELAKDEKK